MTLVLSGCDMGFQTMGSSEHGLVFCALPTFLGGGLQKTLMLPTEKVFIFPWEKLYRVCREEISGHSRGAS